MSKWHRLILGNLLFVALPVVYTLVAAPAAILAFAFLPSLAESPSATLTRGKLSAQPTFYGRGPWAGRAYVLDNGLVVADYPPNPAQQRLAELITSGSGTLTVTASVYPSRLIVVGTGDEIVGIWSNRTDEEGGTYSLTVREDSMSGQVRPLTAPILAEYNALFPDVDWSVRGRVFP